MAYAGIQMFMEKLKQLVNCCAIPFINSPEILDKFQLLYKDLDSLTNILFIDEHQDLEKLNDLKQRFTYAAEEAQYIVDLFLYDVHNRSTTVDFSTSLNLDDVRKSFKSFKMEFDGMNMDPSRRPEITLNQSAPAQYSITGNSPRSKNLMDEIIMGLDHDAELIRDKLTDDKKKRDVVSIVGTGGIGKTTLATKVFNDSYVKYYFDVRVWVTVSQSYDKRAVLTQILESIGVESDIEKANDSLLGELVHKHLHLKRYLVVIDDIWHIQTWDSLNSFFHCYKNGSRILLTSRLTEVAKHANSNGLIHQLGYLNKERSWKLLCHKVFQGNECPEWLVEPGMQIVENCQGLPLAVVVIAGVLEKETRNKEFWVEIAKKTGSYIVGDQNGCLETLALSYNHLPHHLRECFLYLGGFPEDYMFKVQRLIWLWVAEGFIQQDGNRSLEDIAESYLMDLIDRNLVIVADKNMYDGAVIACKVHDLVRELCLRKAEDERFFLLRKRLILTSQLPDVITQPYKPVRVFINEDISFLPFPYSPAQNLRSLLWFSHFSSLRDVIANSFSSFKLLRVLDLQKCIFNDFPKSVEFLVHLRYLAIWNWNKFSGFPSSICNLWRLQTLIIPGTGRIVLPSNLSNLINLRHLWTDGHFVLPSIERPMKNLQTISDVLLEDGFDNFQKCFPNIKELTCATDKRKQFDFTSLISLEKLKLAGYVFGGRVELSTFPTSLKTLELKRLSLGDMSIVESIPNLQALNLEFMDFEGSCWNTDEQEFPQLKFLRLESLNIKQWEAYSRSFPCLIQLEIIDCSYLKGFPFEIGDIQTLELIQIKECSQSLGDSVRSFEVKQRDSGKDNLKIDILKEREDLNSLKGKSLLPFHDMYFPSS